MRTLVRDPRASAARLYGVGLGFYAFLRFHVDTHQVSAAGTWTRQSRRSCPPIVQPADVATVGQPSPQPAPLPADAAGAGNVAQRRPRSPRTTPQSDAPQPQRRHEPLCC